MARATIALLFAGAMLLCSDRGLAQATGSAVIPASAEAAKDLAPSGALRASINLGNVVLAKRDVANGALSGVSVDLARELGRRLSVPVELVAFEAAGKVFDGFKAARIDVMFLAIEPARAQEISFTAPYVLIEGAFMVPKSSSLTRVDEFDRPGLRISVRTGSAYDLYLTRTLKHAELVRGADGLAEMTKDGLEAAAGVRQAVEIYARTDPKVRIIPGRFMEIQQAVGTPKERVVGHRYLQAFVEEVKASGFVADALKRHNQPDAAVAPPAAR